MCSCTHITINVKCHGYAIPFHTIFVLPYFFAFFFLFYSAGYTLHTLLAPCPGLNVAAGLLILFYNFVLLLLLRRGAL